MMSKRPLRYHTKYDTVLPPIRGSLPEVIRSWCAHHHHVLARLEAMVVAATNPSSEAEAEAAEARVCIICEEAPREVRFACGHATVCSACLPSVVDTHRKCPTCNTPFGAQPIAEQGAHVQSAPTFVMPAPARRGGRARGR